MEKFKKVEKLKTLLRQNLNSKETKMLHKIKKRLHKALCLPGGKNFNSF